MINADVLMIAEPLCVDTCWFVVQMFVLCVPAHGSNNTPLGSRRSRCVFPLPERCRSPVCRHTTHASKNDSDRPIFARAIPIACHLQERFRSPTICKSDPDRLPSARAMPIAHFMQERCRSPIHLPTCKGDPGRNPFARAIPTAHVCTKPHAC